MARPEFKRLVNDGGAGNGSSENKINISKRADALLGYKVDFIRVIFLTEDKVPGEVGH